jgi:DNA repair protein SbcD/Mre11
MKTPLRIAHLADTHLGYRHYSKADPETGRNQRQIDIEHAFVRAVDDILTRDVDLIIHAGDVFDHTRPSWSTLRVFVQTMRRIEAAGIPCVVIAGNHDTPRLRTSGSVYSLLEMVLPNIRFAAGYEQDRPFKPVDLGVAVHAVPHGALTNPDPPLPILERDARNVLVFHGLAPQVQATLIHEPGEETLLPEQMDERAEYIALGHYHLHGEQTRNAWYSGSTERFGFRDERAEPGYNLVTLGEIGEPARVEHITIPVRPMRTLKRIEGADMEARTIANLVLDRVTALAEPDAMARIELHGVPRTERRQVDRIVRAEIGDTVWALEIRTPTDFINSSDRLDLDAELPPLPELFQQFVNEQVEQGRYDERFAEAFRARGSLALNEAVRLSAEQTANQESAS